MEQRVANKFCVKLKKTAIEMSEILYNVYGEEWLSTKRVCLNGLKCSGKGESLQNGGQKDRP
jgi:hypothetical protein